MAVNGVAGATYDNFVILFAKQDLHADGYILGLMTTATGVANTVMWWIQPYLIGALGPRLLLVMAMASTTLRCWLYTVVHGQWAVIAVQLLHGVSWVCIWSGGTAFMHEIAPPELCATAQGILFVCPLPSPPLPLPNKHPVTDIPIAPYPPVGGLHRMRGILWAAAGTTKSLTSPSLHSMILCAAQAQHQPWLSLRPG